MTDTDSSVEIVLTPGQIIRPEVSITLATELIAANFGVQIKKIKELNGYDDKNYYVEAVKNGAEDDGVERYVFKILNSLDSQKKHVFAQNAAMLHLKSRGIRCPVPLESVHEGDTCLIIDIGISTDSENNVVKRHAIRLLSFVEGEILFSVKITKELIFRIGSLGGEILKHFRDFSHPGLKNETSVWYLGSVPTLHRFLYVLKPEKQKYDLISEVFDAFKARVVTAYPQLEKGVIHGDINEQNLLVRKTEQGSYEVAGIIDFGDMQESYCVFEAAVCLAYMMLQSITAGIDPLEGSGHALAGFMESREFSHPELKVLPTCIAARLAQSLLLGRYSHSLDPTNDYVLTTGTHGWGLLERLWNTSDMQLFGIWRKIVPSLPNIN